MLSSPHHKRIKGRKGKLRNASLVFASHVHHNPEAKSVSNNILICISGKFYFLVFSLFEAVIKDAVGLKAVLKIFGRVCSKRRLDEEERRQQQENHV